MMISYSFNVSLSLSYISSTNGVVECCVLTPDHFTCKLISLDIVKNINFIEIAENFEIIVLYGTNLGVSEHGRTVIEISFQMQLMVSFKKKCKLRL